MTRAQCRDGNLSALKAKCFTRATVDHAFSSHQLWSALRWGERKFHKTKQESSNYFYRPDAIAKIPRNDCYSGKLATPRNNFCLQGWQTAWWGNQQHSGKYHLWLPAPPSVSILPIRGKGHHTVLWLHGIPCRLAFQRAISSAGERHISNFPPQAPFPANLHITTLASSLTQGWTCTKALSVSWQQMWIMEKAVTSI